MTMPRLRPRTKAAKKKMIRQKEERRLRKKNALNMLAPRSGR